MIYVSKKNMSNNKTNEVSEIKMRGRRPVRPPRANIKIIHMDKIKLHPK